MQMFFKHSSIILAIAISFFTLTNLTQAQSWIQLSPSGTIAGSGRYGHTAVYDAVNNRMTVFGGEANSGFLNDVWVLSTANGLGNSAWTQITATGTAPSARLWHTAIYDTTNNRMVIFGGWNGSNDLNDVWVLSTANGLGISAWTQLNPNPDPTYGSPTARQNHSAVYDSANNRMIIFGGNDNDFNSDLNDVWVLSNANGVGGTADWTLLHPNPDPTNGFPTTRQGHSAVYDSTHNRMIIFGGNDNNITNNFLSDVWVLSTANGIGGTPQWTMLFPSVEPLGRDGHTAIYDNANNVMTIFGGYRSGNVVLNDVWTLSNANGLGGTYTWTSSSFTGSTPSKRYFHIAVYNATDDRMTIFGGYNDSSFFNDVWVLSDATGNGSGPLPTSIPKEIWELFN
jgi:hypothetical protein